MTKGRDALVKDYPHIHEKLISDSGISAQLLEKFLLKLDEWDEISDFRDHFDLCCIGYQFHGEVPPLLSDEKLGTAQKFNSLLNSFSDPSQYNLSSKLPLPDKADVQRRLSRALGEVDETQSLTLFHKYFGSLRLRAINSNSLSRIFAFRNSKNPQRPVSESEISATFSALAIPNADPRDYVMIVFSHDKNEKIAIPTCFDATFRNLGLFEPGGKTAGGIPEVIVTPPRCKNITHTIRQFL